MDASEIPTMAVTAAYKRVGDQLADRHYGQAAGRQLLAGALAAAAPYILTAEHRRLRDLLRANGGGEFAHLIVPGRPLVTGRHPRSDGATTALHD